MQGTDTSVPELCPYGAAVSMKQMPGVLLLTQQLMPVHSAVTWVIWNWVL